MTSQINNAFATELEDFIIEHKPDYWIYGHSHVNTKDFMIGNTRMRTNQLGYIAHGENIGFKHDAVIEI